MTKSCGFRDPETQLCQLLQGNIPAPEDCRCPLYNSEPMSCAFCNKIIISSPCISKKGAEWLTICGDCAALFGTCHMCEHGQECDFQTNPSPLPMQVQKQVQQGPMIQIMTIKNPERVEETCKKNCACWSEQFGCMKENGTCEKYGER